MPLDQMTLAPVLAHWSVHLPTVWDVLGPFPIHAREQHFLSPSFPIDVTKPLDLNQTYPSSYADHGIVSWAQIQSELDGSLIVTFPTVRWETLRATEGWAALQHHAVLHSTLTLQPPMPSDTEATNPTLLVELMQASYFAILPRNTPGLVPKWYTGNIYGIQNGLPHGVPLPVPPSRQEATVYDIFISADYEIRLFGDPRTQNSTAPKQHIAFQVAVENRQQPVVHVPSQDIVCDFVDGVAFGSAFGIGIRSMAGWWTADSIFMEEPDNNLELVLAEKVRIAPSQTRIVPLRVFQKKPFLEKVLNVRLFLVSDTRVLSIAVTLSVNQLQHWLTMHQAIKGSYFFSLTMPTNFIVVPPRGKDIVKTVSAVLALHGAGVDILSQPFWVDALPVQDHLWTVVPIGRTTWGLDWHGPSRQDAWDSVEALIQILKIDVWIDWKPQSETPVIVIGHSNGGQGAWHLAVHNPDRIAGVIAAAGYIKSQAYVPLTLSRSAHYIDPMLRAILETSLTPDDNDLFLSNLAGIPVFAIHGGDDDNVPVWHGREMVNTLLYHGHDPNKIRFREDLHQGHWYPTVFQGNDICSFFNGILTNVSSPSIKPGSFTLTVSSPSEFGSKHGWKIEELLVIGRLGTLIVEYPANTNLPVKVTSQNVAVFTVTTEQLITSLIIDGQLINVALSQQLHFIRTAVHWVVGPGIKMKSWLPTRLQSVLLSPGPLIIIVEDNVSGLSAALRIAHDLNAYHQLDSCIIFASHVEALEQLSNTTGNIIYMGSPNTTFVRHTLSYHHTPARVSAEGHAMIHGHQATGNGLATLLLHPHPGKISQVVVLMLAEDEDTLEQILRLFPLRTGISLPAWVITSKGIDKFAAAGIVGAGLWGQNWTWSAQASWIKSPLIHEVEY